MKVLKIFQVPSNLLKEKTDPIEEITPDILELIENMKYTLIKQDHPKGVGLSAPQVGRLLQLFVLREEEDKPFRVFMNPKVTLRGTKKIEKKSGDEALEGCLSIHGLWGIVDRAPVVIIEYLGEDGFLHKEKLKGFIAQIIQHEYDHLQGILFPIRVLESKKRLYRSTQNEKGEDALTPVGPSFNI